MTKITATTFVTLDGVTQAPGAPDEDRSGGFPHGGWLVPFADDDMGEFVTEAFAQADGFLLGRRTYEIFASYWPHVTDAGNPIATGLNTLPKHVVSTTLDTVAWHNSTLIRTDVEAAVRALKERPGREIQIHGSGTLVRSLLRAGLIDEWRLLTFPVYLGTGARVFAENGVPTAFDPVDSRTTGSGVVIQRLRPTGPPTYGSFDDEGGA